MKGYLYCIEDKVSKQIMPPYFSSNDNCAKRDFLLGAFQSMTPIQDLNLWRIAEFNSVIPLEEDTNPTIQLSSHTMELVNPTLAEVEAYRKAYDEFDFSTQEEHK